MADIATLEIVVELRNGEMVVRQLDNLKGQAGQTEQATTKLRGSWMLLAEAMGIATAAFHKVVEETIAAQYAMAQLESSVRATGGAAGFTVAQLDAMARSLQASSMYSDEQIKSAQGMLLTFQQIRGVNFERTLQAVLDLSSKMGWDLPHAALILGKAMESPAAGLVGLERAIGRFTDAEKLNLQQMVDNGRVVEAQGVILDRLKGRVSGTAEDMRNTLGGALRALKNQWGDVFELSARTTEPATHAINNVRIAVQMLSERLHENFKSQEEFKARWDKLLAQEQARHDAVMSGKKTEAKADDEAKRKADERRDAETANAKAVREANEDMVRVARQGYIIAQLSDEEKERQKILDEAANQTIDAQRKLTDELLESKLRAIEAEKQWRLEALAAGKALVAQNEAMKVMVGQLSGFEGALKDTMTKGITEAFGKIGSLFESFTGQLLDIWVTKFVEPMIANLLKIDLQRMRLEGEFPGEGALRSGGTTKDQLIGAAGLFAGVMAIGIGWMNKAAEEERALAEATKQFTFDLAEARATITGTSLETDIVRVREQFAKLREEAKALNVSRFSGDMAGWEAYQNALRELDKLEQQRINDLIAESEAMKKYRGEELEVRRLRATGAEAEADALAFSLEQQKELDQAIREHWTEQERLTLIEVQAAEAARFAAEQRKKELEAEVSARQTELQAHRQALDALTQTTDTLRDYANSLRAGGGSPTQNLAEARRQFAELAARARAGDQEAARQLPQYGNQLLSLSREYFASGAGYQADLKMVQEIVEALGDKYDVMRQLEEEQVDLLQKILDELQKGLPGIVIGNRHPIPEGGWNWQPWGPILPPPRPPETLATLEVLSAGFVEVADRLESVGKKIDASAATITRSLEAVNMKVT